MVNSFWGNVLCYRHTDARRDLSRSARLNALVTQDAPSLLKCACLFRIIVYTEVLFLLIFFLFLFSIVILDR